MSPPIFPTLPGLAWSVTCEDEWNTVKHDAISGKRIRFPSWTFPIHHYGLNINVLRSSPAFNEWQTFRGFFNSVQGAFGVFYYDDPNDDAVTNQEFNVADGVTTAFQLVRTLGGNTEPVFIVNGTPVININGTPTTAFTVSAYGVITFTSAPPPSALLTWSGNFYWPCQFDDDKMSFENFMFQLFKAKSVKFSTLKLP